MPSEAKDRRNPLESAIDIPNEIAIVVDGDLGRLPAVLKGTTLVCNGSPVFPNDKVVVAAGEKLKARAGFIASWLRSKIGLKNVKVEIESNGEARS